jgi:hypothetical protein
MRISDLYKAIISHFSNKSSLINLLFYLIAAGVIGYLYTFKVVAILILFFLSTAFLASFLLEVFILIKNRFKNIDKEFIYSLMLVVIMLPLCFLYLEKQVLGYVGVLSFVIALIGVFAVKRI